MKIGIIGYGKMGKAIEKLAINKGYRIVFKINSKNKNDLNTASIKKIDVAIEFSNPKSAFKNILFCIKHKTPVISGTTGWLEQLNKIEELCIQHDGAFLHAANFSFGMNIFFEINNYISKLMNSKKYNIEIQEKHHLMKQDSPSGTAIHIKNDIEKNMLEYNTKQTQVPIISKRLGKLKGEHIVKYQSEMDEIKISHKTLNRNAFAEGVLCAANFIKNKKGIFRMADVINKL